MAEFFMMMCGVPGSGKSTYARNMISPTLVVSTDYYIEQYAVLMGKTYSEVFKEFIGTATKRMNESVEKLIRDQQAFTWDQTNLTVKSRAKKLARIPNTWHKTIVWMDTSWDKIKERTEIRNKKGDKVISMEIIEGMMKTFQQPTLDEGWDTIMRIKG